jgi:hypothetical protein
MLPPTDDITAQRGDTARERRYVGRAMKVTTVAGDATVTLATDHVGAGFGVGDVGLTIDGVGILEGTTIASRTSALSVELSAPALASGSITASVRSYDLTGCTPTAQVRTSASATDILYTFTCTLTDQEDDPGGVVMQIANGLTDGAPSSAKWDWQLALADGTVRTMGAGKVKFKGQVTR